MVCFTLVSRIHTGTRPRGDALGVATRVSDGDIVEILGAIQALQHDVCAMLVPFQDARITTGGWEMRLKDSTGTSFAPGVANDVSDAIVANGDFATQAAAKEVVNVSPRV